MPEDYVLRRELDRIVADHERRLDGHDALYADLRETREELVRFTEALQNAREMISSGVTARDICQQACATHRSAFAERLEALEKFRWQFGGAVLVLAAVPAWAALIVMLLGR